MDRQTLPIRSVPERMEPRNVLIIMSDQHSRNASGCYGHPLVHTPNIDRLAAEGVRFTQAYTNCPICVPARASLATGRYVHQIGNWDNAFPYDGTTPSWGHHVRAHGHRVDSFGKLHFSSERDDHGFTREHQPMHVVDGIGDLLGAIRRDPPFRHKRDEILEAGAGDSTYLQYDQKIADGATRWLQERSESPDPKPWVLLVSFVCPHPPYIAPPDLFRRYDPNSVPLPPQMRASDWPDHPALDYFRRFFDFDEPFDDAAIRKLTAAYLGMCTHVDHQIGRVLHALQETGQRSDTRIVYTSDHGEHGGARGLFGKFTMYEESAGVPMIIADPDLPASTVVDTPVSLVDLFPTVVEGVGAPTPDYSADLPGESLWRLASLPSHDRHVLSEYHAVGSRSAMFMLRGRRHKYVHYVDGPPQLFDLDQDPGELHNLADSDSHADVLEGMERSLREILDPRGVDAQAKADQQAKIDAFGGREAVIQRGGFHNSPVPGEAPSFRKYGKD